MPKIYTKPEADDKVWQIIRDLLDTHHGELNECDAKIAVVLVESDTGDAITHGGYRAYAKVRLATGLERSLQHGRDRFDAVIQIDGLVWKNLREEIAIALIDHELSHLYYTGEQHDDTRPKLKLRKGDWNVGDGFESVLKRHGINSLEYMAIRQITFKTDDDGNYLFDFAQELGTQQAPEMRVATA